MREKRFYIFVPSDLDLLTFSAQICSPSYSCPALRNTAVAEWYGAGLCDREVAGSTPARGCCVPTPTQRAIPPGSVNEYQRKLGSKRAYHAMH